MNVNERKKGHNTVHCALVSTLVSTHLSLDVFEILAVGKTRADLLASPLHVRPYMLFLFLLKILTN